jgi:hypothetical protein
MPPINRTSVNPTPPSSKNNEVEVQLTNFPSTIKAGGPAIQFDGTLTNHGNVTLHDVAPLFQIVGGQCNCAQGILEQADSEGYWKQVPMPEGDGDPNFLARATGGIILYPGKSIVFHYRLTMDRDNPTEPLNAILYAVQLPSGTQLAITSITTHISSDTNKE